MESWHLLSFIYEAPPTLNGRLWCLERDSDRTNYLFAPAGSFTCKMNKIATPSRAGVEKKKNVALATELSTVSSQEGWKMGVGSGVSVFGGVRSV